MIVNTSQAISNIKSSVDVITSAYNEEECIGELFRRLNLVFSHEVNYNFRIIIIDNGSTDSTWEIISSAC